jgi:hypothetical protein
MKSSPPRAPRRLRARSAAMLGLVLCALLASCDNAGRGALTELHQTVQDTLAALPGLVRQVDDVGNRALAHADAVLSRNITSVQETIHTEIDVINGVLGARIDQVGAVARDRIDQLDLAMSARITQLGAFATQFVSDLQALLTGTIKELHYTGDALISRLNQSGIDVVENAGFTVSRTFESGGKVMAVVTRSLLDGAILLAAIGVLITIAILAFLFFRRLAAQPARRPAQWIPVTVILCLGSAAAAVVHAHEFHASGSKDEAQRAAVQLELYQCIASSGASELRAEARKLLGQLRTVADPRCTHNEDCDASKGEHCDLATSLCTSRCTVDHQCPSGKVCNALGACTPPCVTYKDCEAGQICQAGHCALAAQCAPGSTRACGPSNTAPCRQGTETCDDTGHWAGCVGNIDPKPADVCITGDDSSCDGVAANGFDGGNRSVCKCLIGTTPTCDCAGKCAGLKGTQSCDADGHALGACTCSCDCTPSTSEQCPCENGCSGTRSCDGAGRWGGCNCPSLQCPNGFSPRGDVCAWTGGNAPEFGWSVTGTPENSVFQTLEPPGECSIAGASCSFLFSVRDNRGDCKSNDERALEVRCADGTSLTLTAGDIRNEQQWRIACNGVVSFKKLASAYNWGFKGCMRNVGEPRVWEAVTASKRCP